MNATELLQQRFEQEKQDYEGSFQREWQAASQRFGPVGRNPQVEAARQRALSAVRQQWSARADTLQRAYNKKVHELTEVDRLIQDPAKAEEVKARLVLPVDVEKAVFPKPEEESEPLKVYGQLHAHESRVNRELGRFETEGPTRHKGSFWGKNWMFGGGAKVLETKGGGVLVVEEVFNEETGKTEKIRRNARRDELEKWASLKQESERVSAEKEKVLTELRKSDHTAARLRLAAVNSPRMGGGGGRMPEPEETSRSKKLNTQIAMQYLHVYGDRAKAMEAARRDGYVE